MSIKTIYVLWSQYSPKCQELFDLIEKYSLGSFKYMQLDDPRLREYAKTKLKVKNLPALLIVNSSNQIRILQNQQLIEWFANIIASLGPIDEDIIFNNDIITSQQDGFTSEQEILNNKDCLDEYNRFEPNNYPSQRDLKKLNKGASLEIKDKETGVKFYFPGKGGDGGSSVPKSRIKQKRIAVEDKVKAFKLQRNQLDKDSDDDEFEEQYTEEDEYEEYGDQYIDLDENEESTVINISNKKSPTEMAKEIEQNRTKIIEQHKQRGPPINTHHLNMKSPDTLDY